MYCGICGDREDLSKVIKWWDPDDGWKIGHLCTWCKEDYGDVKPKPGDYAYEDKDNIHDSNVETDEDPILALLGEE